MQEAVLNQFLFWWQGPKGKAGAPGAAGIPGLPGLPGVDVSSILKLGGIF